MGLCTGWVAGPRLGGSGTGADIAASLGHHKPYEMLLGVLRCEGCVQVRVQPHRCPSAPKSGSFTNAAACISPKEKLWGAEEGCEKWKESGGDIRAKAVAGISPSPACLPRGEQANFMALSAQLIHPGWTCSTWQGQGLAAPRSRVWTEPLGRGGVPGPPPHTAPNLLQPFVLTAKLVCHPCLTLCPQVRLKPSNNYICFSFFCVGRQLDERLYLAMNFWVLM